MRPIAALALAIAAVAWAHALGETGTVPSAGAALALGFTLLGAWISCLLYTSPSPRERQKYRMPSSA